MGMNMKWLWNILQKKMPDELCAYLGVPLFGWAWIDSVANQLELYRRGFDETSFVDFIGPSVWFVLWSYSLMWAVPYLRHRMRGRRSEKSVLSRE
jgi:hypothetical protein